MAPGSMHKDDNTTFAMIDSPIATHARSLPKKVQHAIVKLLLEHGTDSNVQTAPWRSTRLAALVSVYKKIVELLTATSQCTSETGHKHTTYCSLHNTRGSASVIQLHSEVLQ
jgi:hypothetical protein